MDADTRIRLFMYFLAGALATFVAFAVAHNAYPALCGLDGTVVAGWAQVLAIAVTGGVGVWVAWTQLRRFGENERAKTTVEFLNLYSHGSVQLSDKTSITTAIAVSELIDLLQGPHLEAFKAGARLWYANAERFKATDKDGARQYLRINNDFVIGANFFVKMAGLSRSGYIDGDLLLSFLSGQVLDVWAAAEAFSDVEPFANGCLSNTVLKDFVKKARLK